MSTAPTDAFKASTEKLPPADPKDTLLASVNADCKALRDLCWDMRDFCRKFEAAKTDFEVAMRKGESPSLSVILETQNEFTKRETAILALRDSIEKRVADNNLGKPTAERIYLSHTAEGLPFRADKTRKTPLWG